LVFGYFLKREEKVSHDITWAFPFICDPKGIGIGQTNDFLLENAFGSDFIVLEGWFAETFHFQVMIAVTGVKNHFLLDLLALYDTDLLFKDFEAVELSHFGKKESNFLLMVGLDVVDIAIVETDFFLNLNTDIVSIWKVHDVSVLFNTLNDVFAGNVHSANIAGTINDFIIFEGERFAIFFAEGVPSDEQD
jgi:hypothetical protein